MPGEIDTCGLLFQLQELEKIELLHLGQDLPHRHRFVRQVKEVDLSGQVLAVLLVNALQESFIAQQELPAPEPEAVQGTALDEPFHHPLIEVALAHPGAEVHEIREGTAFPFLHQVPDHCVTDILDGGKAEPDLVPAYREARLALKHRRRQYFDTQPPAFADVLSELGGVVQHTGE